MDVVNPKRGDKVYLVVPKFGVVGPNLESTLAPDDHYYVQQRTLVVASPKQLRLDSYFFGGPNLIYPPTALGREFFATPEEAVEVFLRRCERSVENARSSVQTAEARLESAVRFAAAWRTKRETTPEDL